MFLTVFYKKQNIALTMPLTMLIAHHKVQGVQIVQVISLDSLYPENMWSTWSIGHVE